jgi:hypothetical protein
MLTCSTLLQPVDHYHQTGCSRGEQVSIISDFESATCVRERVKSASADKGNEKDKIGNADVLTVSWLANPAKMRSH